jgi:hypothetical protein
MNRYTGTDQFRMQSPNSRSLQLISSIAELLKVFAEGNLQGYFQVIQLSHQ